MGFARRGLGVECVCGRSGGVCWVVAYLCFEVQIRPSDETGRVVCIQAVYAPSRPAPPRVVPEATCDLPVFPFP